VGELSVHLLEGFADDRVELTVDGEILSEDAVTTQLLLGLAATLVAEIRDGPAVAEIRVPTRGLSATLALEVRGHTHLLVSIEDGALAYQVSDAAPGYM
jgi:hypothetical protein